MAGGRAAASICSERLRRDLTTVRPVACRRTTPTYFSRVPFASKTCVVIGIAAAMLCLTVQNASN
jgi:hypothetical protein